MGGPFGGLGAGAADLSQVAGEVQVTCDSPIPARNPVATNFEEAGLVRTLVMPHDLRRGSWEGDDTPGD